jgi:enamine deaminase RidA (YjgF/YER057c/UK114 family)
MLERYYVTPENVNKLADITRTTTYTTDVKTYFEVVDERFKFFSAPLSTSTLIGVAALAMPEMLVEIECEAVIEPERLRLPKTGVVHAAR